MDRQPIYGKNISLGYGKGKRQKIILQGLDFALNSGSLTCLLGPNGVGKSTLIRAMMGKIEPFEGQLQLFGQSSQSISRSELAKKMAVVLSEPRVPDQMTVAQLVSLGRTPYLNWTGKLSSADLKVVEQALEGTRIGYLKEERLGELSDGQRQKAMIARALAQDCPVMILDEPTSHLDLVNRLEIMQLLQDIAHHQNKSILVVTHDLDVAIETAHDLWLLPCGMPLISGTPEDLVLNNKLRHLLPSDRYQFDARRGKVILQQAKQAMAIEGPEDLVFWVEKAILKKSCSPTDKVLVENEPFGIRYQGKKFDSIAAFLSQFS